MMMPSKVLTLAVPALFLLVVVLAVAGLVVYRRIVQRLKDQNHSELLGASSRWALFRFLWRGDESRTDPPLHSLLRLNRVLMVAYAIVALVWLVVVAVVLLRQSSLPA